LVEKSGAWYSYKGERLGQGRDQAKEYLKANLNVKEELRKLILTKNGIGQLLLTADMADAVSDEATVEMDTPKKGKKAKDAIAKEAASEKTKLN